MRDTGSQLAATVASVVLLDAVHCGRDTCEQVNATYRRS